MRLESYLDHYLAYRAGPQPAWREQRQQQPTQLQSREDVPSSLAPLAGLTASKARPVHVQAETDLQ